MFNSRRREDDDIARRAAQAEARVRVTNSRIHLKWNSGFDPSFGVLRRSDLRLAIIRTPSDGRDVTQLGPEVFSGTSISQGAQYLGMDTVNSPSQVGRELMC
jgi:hypothetical protein